MLTKSVNRVRKFVRSLRLSAEDIRRLIEVGYRVVLRRTPDPDGLACFTAALRSGRVSPSEFLLQLYLSPEGMKARRYEHDDLFSALHAGRVAMVRQLPRADVIVDLGGGAAETPQGALVVMGYPYRFRTLTIVEPPRPDRHDIYQNVAPGDLDRFESDRGEVRYLYRSMADLSGIPSGSVDLVFSGESIEHVSRDDCERVLAEARRVLKPTGWFCFDTPNRALTRLHVGEEVYVNPDHRYEYTHAEMTDLLARHRFEVVEAKGIGWMPQTAASGTFELGELLLNAGLYDDPENGYLLYYRCRPRA